jgi:hypothetical protein
VSRQFAEEGKKMTVYEMERQIASRDARGKMRMRTDEMASRENKNDEMGSR